jgi:hypothetical protein
VKRWSDQPGGRSLRQGGLPGAAARHRGQGGREGRISVEAALRHYTRDGAYASVDEDVRGTLAAGKRADFVVLSKDIRTIPPAEIATTKVLRTVMGGKDTYRAQIQ